MALDRTGARRCRDRQADRTYGENQAGGSEAMVNAVASVQVIDLNLAQMIGANGITPARRLSRDETVDLLDSRLESR